VVARFASRPIPLDKGAIRRLADDLAKQVAAYAARQPPDMLLGHDHRMLQWAWTAKTVKGEDIKVDGFFFSQPGKSPNLITGAHTQEVDVMRDLEEGDVHLGIRLNGSLPFSAFTDGEHEGTNGLRYQIYNELVHELTHVAEWWYLQKKKVVEESDVKSAPDRARDYYNSPHEIRAYMQQIIEEILPKAAGFRKHVVPHGTPHEYILKLLNTSAKWKQISRFLNPQNEAKILKAVYDALVREGILSP
jgi:hypothetical protein